MITVWIVLFLLGGAAFVGVVATEFVLEERLKVNTVSELRARCVVRLTIILVAAFGYMGILP